MTLTRKADNLLEVASKASEAAAFAAEHTASTNSTELALGAKDAAGAFAWEAVGAARSASDAERWAAAWNAAEATELRGQAELLWDIYGNPFRPVTLDPGWRTPDVLSLAQAADEHRALPAGTLEPARLALVADALEDAGCDNADLLGHLRSEGSHVRGCWAVDLVLGWE